MTNTASTARKRTQGAAAWLAAGAVLALTGCAGQQAARPQPLPRAGTVYEADGRKVQLTGLTALPAPSSASAAGTSPLAAGDTVPPGYQFLYGSGEAAALSRQAFRGLVTLAVADHDRHAGHSVVLAPDATLAAPSWVDCATKPHAAVFDADETVLLNLGAEEQAARHPGPFDAEQWTRWERTGAAAVAPAPGAVEAFAALRHAGVTVIINSNRDVTTAAGTVAALKAAGLGSFTPGETLFLRDGSSGKDGRRATIAQRYCVVAMAGDQLGDFSDLFAAISSPAVRRAAADAGAIGERWGNGWFVLPNPVYGSALKGGFDDVFPLDKRWTDPGAASGQ
ncbi:MULTISPECIES: HAD family acid phosphatase [unclassified Sphingomonas]|uniref:HAD family acid phosphatase n=1 Tax=unclassified Sphingomonas TaxID=196159 RepID=UPI002269B18F|nr:MULTISPECIES: HAD family acid phosphatase [unclassified Sphingomonas]